MSGFNLVEEPWIPCIMPDGQRQEVSLQGAICGAHEIREVYDPSPLVTVSLHRLLLAVVHRVFGPKGSDDWIRLWTAGRWDAPAVERYLAIWRNRFELFDPDRPFGQVAYMDDTDEHSIAYLLLEAASGNNATLFNHGVIEGSEGIPPGRAACYLLANQSFAIGFGKSKPFYFRDGPLTRGLSVLAYGNNLFETLALNLMPDAFWTGFPPREEDAPFWERDSLPEPDERGTFPLGRADYLTWMSRRIHLIAKGDPRRVTRCQIRQNYCLPAEPRRWDPFKPYRRDEDGALSTMGLAADRAAWRECHSLLHMKMPRGSRADLLNWLGEVDGLRVQGRIQAQPQYRLAIFGLATAAGKAASVEMWRSELLPLPLSYLNDERLLDKLKEALELAKEVGSALNRSLWFLGGRLVKGPEVELFVRQLTADSLFWPRLEEPFRYLMVMIPQDDRLDRWGRELATAARNAFQAVRRQLETSSGVLKALTAADDYFGHELAKALTPLRGEENHEPAD